MLKVKISKAVNHAVLPQYANPGDAGFDLLSAEDLILKAGEQRLIGTGVKMAIPDGHVGLIWDKSGMGAKKSVKVFGGVVDSGYRGEVKVSLRNFGGENLEVTRGMKLAQMLIQPVISAHIEEADELDETVRGEGGFGSTGTHIKETHKLN